MSKKKDIKVKCPKCKTESDFNAKTCSNCGYNLAKSKKTNLIILGVFALIVIIIMNAIPRGTETDANLNELEKKTTLNKEKSEEVLKQFEEVGINTLKNITEITTNDEGTNYNATASNDNDPLTKSTIHFFITKDNELREIMINYNNSDFEYLIEGKIVVSNFKDFTVTSSELAEYQILTQNTIKPLLKTPDSAKFKDYNKMKYKGTVTLQGNVDSKNSLGNTVTSKFQVIIDTKNNNKMSSLIIDGKEYIK